MDTRPPPNKNRLPLYIGLGVAGIAGYYLYSAGGSPKVAKKEVERRSTDGKGKVVGYLADPSMRVR